LKPLWCVKISSNSPWGCTSGVTLWETACLVRTYE
jgi:hypothetical protein